MRKSEIEIGGEYALVTYEGQRPQRVRVVEFGVGRRVYSGSNNFRGHTSKDGTRVEILDRETGATNMRTVTREVELETPVYNIGVPPQTTMVVEEQVPVTDVVINAHIKRTWADQVELNEAQARSEKASADNKARRDAQLSGINDVLQAHGLIEADLYKRLSFVYRRTEHRGYAGYTDTRTVEVPTDVLSRLIEIAGLTVENGQAL